MVTFDELVAEATAAPFTGWDFSWLDARSTTEDLPWSYAEEVARYAATARTMVDMGTGGGEVLAGWAVPEYSLEAFLPALRAAWLRPGTWPLPVTGRRFIVVARKATAAAA